MGFVTSGRRTQAEGMFTINRGADSIKPWSEITVEVFNAAGQPVTTATGVITGMVQKIGQGKPQPLENTLDLSTDNWSFTAELSGVQNFMFSITGLNALHTYEITIISPEF